MAFNQAKFTSQLQAVADYFKEALINFGAETATHNVRDLINAIKLTADEGSFAAALSARATNTRTRYAQAVAGAVIRDLMDPIFLSYLRDVIGVPPDQLSDVASSWGRIFEHFIYSAPGTLRGTPYTVQTRGITRGTTAASSSGTGNGVIYRLTEDRYGYETENSPAPCDIDFECISDESRGADPGEEVFEITVPGGTDILDQGDSVGFNRARRIAGLNSDGDFLSDASFQITTNASGDADPDDLGAWEDPTGVYGSAKYALDTGDPYMASVEEEDSGVSVCLEIKGSHKIQQELEGLSALVPYFWSVAARPGAALSAGALTVGWGSKTQAFTLTSLSGGLGAYTSLVPTLDKDLYPWNFSDSSNLFSLEITTPLASDTVKVDNVRFGPMIPFAGTWWFIDPGTTQFLSGTNKKTFKFQDTLAGADAIIQRLIWLAYGLYLPHTAAATPPTITDP